MEQQASYDIHEICARLGTTSRTLRFYEEKGLITCIKTPFSPRRRYTAEQIDRIRNILTLRSLGLSVKTITALQHEDAELKEAVLSRRAEMLASIHTKVQELARLGEALAMLEAGKDIAEAGVLTPQKAEVYEKTVHECTAAIVRGDTTALYRHFSDRLKAYLPEAVYKTVWADTARPLGAFAAFEAIERDKELHSVYCQYVRYQKLGLRIQFVFHGEAIDGLWMSYYELKGERKP